jgi:hypothetical protein
MKALKLYSAPAKRTSSKRRVAKRAAPKRSAKKAPKRAARAKSQKPKARAASGKRSPVEIVLRPSRLPTPANLQSRSSNRGTLAFGGVGWALAGAAVLWMLLRKSDAKAEPALPVPSKPPEAPPVTPTPKPTLPALTDAQKLAVEYRRAKSSELPRDVLARAPSFLTLPMGAISFFDSEDGRQFAAVLEEHFHSAESGLKPVGKHKGVSMFVKR